MGVPDPILDFVADSARVERARIQADTRIREDLGLDGEKAVDFFAGFSARFEVDIHGLYAQWPRYFSQEPARLGLKWLGLGAAAVWAPGILREFAHVPMFWSIQFLLLCGASWCWYSFRSKEVRLAAAVVVSSSLTTILRWYVSSIPDWVAMPLLLALYWKIEPAIPGAKLEPIVVQDLVAAAAAHSWIKANESKP